MTVKRFDRGELRKPSKLKNGWLRVDAFLTRTGVFEYLEAGGKKRRELRLPEEVFRVDALKSLELLPVTLEHPPEPLDASNTKEYQAGNLGERIDNVEGKVRASMLITDAPAVRALEDGEAREVSCGYECDLEQTPGTWNGERYDAVQRNIVYNHVAIVPRGRAGAEVRVRMDASAAAQVTSGDASPTSNPGAPASTSEEFAPMKIRIDGVEYNGDEQLAQAVSKLQTQHADALAKTTTELEAKRKELDAATAKLDAANEKVKELEKAKKDAEDPKRIRELITARVALETVARKHLDAKELRGLDKMSDRDIKLAVLAELAPSFKADGKGEEYVQARFDAEVENAESREDEDDPEFEEDEESDDAEDRADEDDEDEDDEEPAEDLRTARRVAADAAPRSSSRVDADEARQKMLKRASGGWRKTLEATK